MPFLKVRAAIARRNAKAAVKGLVCGRELTTNDMRCKQEFESVDYAGVFMDYNELAIQFGYTTLFAVAFPAAPMLAFVNNVIEARRCGTPRIVVVVVVALMLVLVWLLLFPTRWP